MDPNANLKEQRALAQAILRLDDDGNAGNVQAIAEHAVRLAELVTALDDWIDGGGFLPSTWQRKP